MAVKVKVHLQLGPGGPQDPPISSPSPSGPGLGSLSQKAEGLHREGKESLETALSAHLQRRFPWTPLCPLRGHTTVPGPPAPPSLIPAPTATCHSHGPASLGLDTSKARMCW